MDIIKSEAARKQLCPFALSGSQERTISGTIKSMATSDREISLHIKKEYIGCAAPNCMAWHKIDGDNVSGTGYCKLIEKPEEIKKQKTDAILT